MELLVTITVIVLIAAMVGVVYGRVQRQRDSVKCMNFIRQLGISTLQYAADNDMNLPVTSHQRRQGKKSWTITLQEYAGGKAVFRCPCDENATRPYTYLINDYLTPNPAGAPDIDYSILSRLKMPSETILFSEASKSYANSDHFHFTDYKGRIMPPESFAKQVAVERHGGFANYLFADAHVETLGWESAQELLRKPGSRFLDPSVEPQQ